MKCDLNESHFEYQYLDKSKMTEGQSCSIDTRWFSKRETCLKDLRIASFEIVQTGNRRAKTRSNLSPTQRHAVQLLFTTGSDSVIRSGAVFVEKIDSISISYLHKLKTL
ncbi:hypothetical protein AWENTII_006693 [Aspergillus wentii]